MRKLIAIIYICLIHSCFFVFAFLGDEFLDSLIAKHDELNKSNIKELVRDFDVAIEKATRQGKLRELKLIENEKKDFLANPDSLPSSQFMLSSRTKYETNWWINRQALEKDLKIKIVQLVKEKNISVADKTQAVLEKVEKMKLVPTDVSVGLIGKWKVSMIGKTKQGSIIDYKPVWEFKQDAVIHSIDANISGTWAYEYKNKRIVIYWNNPEKSKESFFLPFNPDGMIGGSWHGFGVKMTAKKVN